MIWIWILCASTECCFTSRKQISSCLPQSASYSDTPSSTWDTSHRMAWALIQRRSRLSLNGQHHAASKFCGPLFLLSLVCSWFSWHSKAPPSNQIVALDEFHWRDQCASAFETLKQALTSPSILGYPADDGTFVLDTDASGHGLGAVLSQIQDASERVILYFRRVLTHPVQQYYVTRRELLAVVESVKYYHHYLLGRHFVVRTDHGSLKWLMRFKNPEGQTWRRIIVLRTYDFEIQHRPGKQHGNANDLSRRPCQGCRHCERQEFKEQSANQEGPDHRICAVTSEPIEGTDRWCEPGPWNRFGLGRQKIQT